ncbi:diagnostic antigen gp50 [Echinococcus multilocularis]|uniref:Diagnostic antigen gp50 n=1 Tax=Echinococcus multilocularis TaxID=6211 RepID=A0A068Y7V2_ECHMU|nr:diagnostic antigen gp50 [Echinococcus multilocularis]
MLRSTFFLVIVAHCSGADPVLWGSRIVGTPAGPSPPMYFRHPKEAAIFVITDGLMSPIKIENGTCYLGDKVWGSPCQRDKESSNITLKDVSLQEALQIWVENSPISTAFFVPNCTTQTSKEDEFDWRTSFPLSRFGKGQLNVEVALAVRGANSRGLTSLYQNGKFACGWRGTTLVLSEAPVCRNMSKDEKSNLRTFVLNITQNTITSIGWYTSTRRMTVNIDWTQNGVSPEIAACNEYWGEMTATTSSGPEVKDTSTSLVALLSMLMLMRALAG